MDAKKSTFASTYKEEDLHALGDALGRAEFNEADTSLFK